MREQEFREWFKTIKNKKGKSFTKENIDFYVGVCNKIEAAYDLDLDTAFEENDFAELFQDFNYTKADDDAKVPNPTKVNFGTSSLLNSMRTHRVALRHYYNFASYDAPEVSTDEEEYNKNSEDKKTIIELEKHLQAALRRHITQLEVGLKIIDKGKEKKVDSGKIDILAKDTEGNIVVIELKAGKARNDVIAQTLGYMKDIADTKKKPVRGIIVAASFNKRIQKAASFVPELELKSYLYNFEFTQEDL